MGQVVHASRVWTRLCLLVCRHAHPRDLSVQLGSALRPACLATILLLLCAVNVPPHAGQQHSQGKLPCRCELLLPHGQLAAVLLPVWEAAPFCMTHQLGWTRVLPKGSPVPGCVQRSKGYSQMARQLPHAGMHVSCAYCCLVAMPVCLLLARQFRFVPAILHDALYSQQLPAHKLGTQGRSLRGHSCCQMEMQHNIIPSDRPAEQPPEQEQDQSGYM